MQPRQVKKLVKENERSTITRGRNKYEKLWDLQVREKEITVREREKSGVKSSQREKWVNNIFLLIILINICLYII